MTNNERLLMPDRKPFKIVCIKAYEFEGAKFEVGDISYNAWGRNVPKNWMKYTEYQSHTKIK